jgi:DNA-3-methyladenine glycosylase
VLDESFYERSVLDVSRDLIGCALLVDGVGGVIVETEAYRADEPACHAYVGLTARSAPLFGPPGHAYVYLSYGVHSCFNVVAEPEGSAAATLVRAIEPRWGIDVMRERRGVADERRLCAGPGMLTQALGIGLELNTRSLGEEPFELRGPEPGWAREPVAATPRVGITKAIELDWRYCASWSRFLSRPLPRAA